MRELHARGEAGAARASTAGRSATSAASKNADADRLVNEALDGVSMAERRSRREPIDPGVDIGHVHLKVADVDRALDFYCGVLGFELMQRYGDDAAFVSAGGYHHHIGLNSWHSKGGSPPPPGTHRPLPHRDPLPDPPRPRRRPAAPAARPAGRSSGASDHGVSEALYLSDPDGNGVELYWDRPREEWPRPPTGWPADGHHPPRPRRPDRRAARRVRTHLFPVCGKKSLSRLLKRTRRGGGAWGLPWPGKTTAPKRGKALPLRRVRGWIMWERCPIYPELGRNLAAEKSSPELSAGVTVNFQLWSEIRPTSPYR